MIIEKRKNPSYQVGDIRLKRGFIFLKTINNITKFLSNEIWTEKLLDKNIWESLQWGWSMSNIGERVFINNIQLMHTRGLGFKEGKKNFIENILIYGSENRIKYEIINYFIENTYPNKEYTIESREDRAVLVKFTNNPYVQSIIYDTYNNFLEGIGIDKKIINKYKLKNYNVFHSKGKNETT